MSIKLFASPPPISPTSFLTGVSESQWLALQRLYRTHYERAIEQAPLPPEHPVALDA